jgi:beta-galactosidase
MRRREFNQAIALAGLGAIGQTVLPGAAGNEPQPIAFNRFHYESSGRPTFLYSGEIHYFRVPKTDWRRRMQLFKDAGGNCIATYVPWVLHEPQEGTFAFGGAEGTLDLEGYLEVAQSVGLNVIVRPGPYIYSELKYDGLPRWLCENYPELHAHAVDGRPFRFSSVSYYYCVIK